MVGQRNRNIEITNFLESLGIEVNINKNKALGNKGFFKAKNDYYRIDVSKRLSEDEIERVLVHEFAHFLHYSYDKSLTDLNFIFDNFNENIEEELLNLTVHAVPKDSAKNLFEQKEMLKIEIKQLSDGIKTTYPDFRASKPFKKIERKIKDRNCKLLLKYDRIKILSWNGIRNYSIENIENDFKELDKNISDYLKLRSKYRYLKRINSKITKLNKYYSSYSEMFARSIETFIYEKDKMKILAPNIFKQYNTVLEKKKLKIFNDFYNIF